MRIPSQFSIHGKLWKVAYKWRLVDDSGNLLDGLCDKSTRMIYLCHGLKDEKIPTFIHEYIHAVFFEYGLHVTSLSEDVEEMICQMLAKEIFEKFRIKWKKYI